MTAFQLCRWLQNNHNCSSFNQQYLGFWNDGIARQGCNRVYGRMQMKTVSCLGEKLPHHLKKHLFELCLAINHYTVSNSLFLAPEKTEMLFKARVFLSSLPSPKHWPESKTRSGTITNYLLVALDEKYVPLGFLPSSCCSGHEELPLCVNPRKRRREPWMWFHSYLFTCALKATQA